MRLEVRDVAGCSQHAPTAAKRMAGRDADTEERDMVAPQQRAKKGFVAAVMGTVIVALCCFTPLLVITLGMVGVGFLTPYLDYILLPALVVMIMVTAISYRKWRQARAGDTVRP